MADEDVLVIGGGPAGVVCGYFLQKAGISYKIIERTHKIASTWDSLYPSLKLNTTRFFSHTPHKRFPLHFGLFPSARQYHQHVDEFAREQRVNIEFGIEVKRVSPEDGQWRVETNQWTETYPVVISATGRFGNPYIPEIEGLDQFKGERIHAQEYRNAQDFADKRILVVGNGPSGVDISVDIAQAAQNPVMIAIRSGIELRPRYPYGLPKHLWTILTEKLPKRWADWILEKVEAVQYTHQEEYGLKLPHGQESGSAVPYRGPELIYAVRDGKVVAVEAPIRFLEHSVEFADGSTAEIDVVILATGYRPVCHQYLDIEYGVDDQDWPLREDNPYPEDRQIRGYPGLYLSGVFYKGKGAMYNFNVEAQVAVEQIQAYLQQQKQPA